MHEASHDKIEQYVCMVRCEGAAAYLDHRCKFARSNLFLSVQGVATGLFKCWKLAGKNIIYFPYDMIIKQNRMTEQLYLKIIKFFTQLCDMKVISFYSEEAVT